MWHPLSLLDRLFTKQASYETQLEKVYVAEPHRVPALFWRAMVAFVLSVAAMFAIPFFERGSPWAILLSVYIGWSLGRGALRQFIRARAYRNGWLDGRMAMVLAMGEAAKRGLEIDEWLDSEFERDQEVMRWL